MGNMPSPKAKRFYSWKTKFPSINSRINILIKWFIFFYWFLSKVKELKPFIILLRRNIYKELDYINQSILTPGQYWEKSVTVWYVDVSFLSALDSQFAEFNDLEVFLCQGWPDHLLVKIQSRQPLPIDHIVCDLKGSIKVNVSVWLEILFKVAQDFFVMVEINGSRFHGQWACNDIDFLKIWNFKNLVSVHISFKASDDSVLNPFHQFRDCDFFIISDDRKSWYPKWVFLIRITIELFFLSTRNSQC